MKLVCSQVELNSALQLVSRAVSSRPTHPVLANVLLTADAGTDQLTLTGFDLNLGIQTSISASVDTSGAITLPAKLLSEIVSKLPNDSPITFLIDETGEQIELKSLSGSYNMRGLSSEDFPELPFVENAIPIKLDPNALIELIRRTLFASSTDEAKQLLTGVHLKFKGNDMEAAATDGHRLAILSMVNKLNNETSLIDNTLDTHDEFSVTLPARSLKEVEKLITYSNQTDLVSMFCDKGQVVFLASNQVVTTRTLEGIYPNYEQLIPNDFSRSLILNRKEFILALERIAILADQHNNVVKIYIDENTTLLKITADAQDVGSGSETIPAILNGESIHIAFNVRYVLDGLKAIDSERIILRCNAPTTPAILSSEDEKIHFTYLVMPVQIRT